MKAAAVFKMALTTFVVLSASVGATGEFPSKEATNNFIVTAMSNKGGRHCPVDPSQSASTSEYVSYPNQTSIDASGSLSFTEVHSSTIFYTGWVVPAHTTYIDRRSVSLPMSGIDIRSIRVQLEANGGGSCGASVRFSGIDARSAGTAMQRTMEFGDFPKDAEQWERINEPCSGKKLKRKNCLEREVALTDVTLYFTEQEIALRFATALQHAVSIYGGPEARSSF